MVSKTLVEENNKAVFDETAAEYDRRADQYYISQKDILKPFVNEVRNVFLRDQEIHVLDIGCGVGLNLKVLANYGFNVCGLDISENMIRYAKKRCPSANFFSGTMQQYNPDRLFSGIIAEAFLHCIPRKLSVDVLKKARRMLLPGGIFICSIRIDGAKEEGWHVKEDYSSNAERYKRYPKREDLESEFKEAGFLVESIHEENNYGKRWLRTIARNPEEGIFDRIFYISGVHSTGKSTVTKTLVKKDGFILHPRSGHSKSDDYLERLKYRIKIYYKDTVEQLQLARNNPECIIIGDRCVFDGLSYVDCFLNLGWIDTKGYDECLRLFNSLFSRTIYPKKIVFIDPDLDWIESRMKERWEKEGSRWKEEEKQFLPASFNSFRKTYLQQRIFGSIPVLLRIRSTSHEQRISDIMKFVEEEDGRG